jgi:hypothetical protein
MITPPREEALWSPSTSQLAFPELIRLNEITRRNEKQKKKLRISIKTKLLSKLKSFRTSSEVSIRP